MDTSPVHSAVPTAPLIQRLDGTSRATTSLWPRTCPVDAEPVPTGRR
ncbi:hypothetical protein [Streptomyces sp. yr375]|nr:hypothetical protein [Streptomyces sp. yr375]